MADHRIRQSASDDSHAAGSRTPSMFSATGRRAAVAMASAGTGTGRPA